MNTKEPTLYMLIGVPGSGKSTWLATQPFDWNKTVVLSTDNYIERVAESQGKTYSDTFKSAIGAANQHLANALADAIAVGHDIVWDQTNTSAKARAAKLKLVPAHYKKIAVVFGTPDEKEHQRRLGSRPGKFIPPDVVASMIKNLQMPTKGEGFSEIWNV